MTSRRFCLVVLTVVALLAACTAGPETAPVSSPTAVSAAQAEATMTHTPAPAATETASPSATAAAPTATVPAAVTATVTATSGPRPTLGPDDWQSLPVVPSGVSERTRLLYQMGRMNGNNPHAYSKVGDCNVTAPYFMADFDTPGSYVLGEYAELQGTVDFFAGSHARKSLAAKDGLTAHAVLSMLWVDWKDCETNDTPLTCEYRLNKPVYAIIAFGTNDASGSVDFEKALRRVLDMTMGSGIIPILATKADNAEGDHSYNRIIASLANEYELPLWNFWRAVQPLPLHGLQDEQHLQHLSVGPKGFTNFEDDNLGYAWSARNLTALQVLDALRAELEEGQ